MRPHRARRYSQEAEDRARDWAYQNLRDGIASRHCRDVLMTRRFCLFMYVPALRMPWIAIDDDGDDAW